MGRAGRGERGHDLCTYISSCNPAGRYYAAVHVTDNDQVVICSPRCGMYRPAAGQSGHLAFSPSCTSADRAAHAIGASASTATSGSGRSSRPDRPATQFVRSETAGDGCAAPAGRCSPSEELPAELSRRNERSPCFLRLLRSPGKPEDVRVPAGRPRLCLGATMRPCGRPKTSAADMDTRNVSALKNRLPPLMVGIRCVALRLLLMTFGIQPSGC